MKEYEIASIQELEQNIQEKVIRENEGDIILADMQGLYVDIIGVIRKRNKEKVVVIYDYAKLLQQEQLLYSSERAYEMGKANKDKPANEIAKELFRLIMAESTTQELIKALQKSYDEILELLDEYKGLITDFTETYRMIHGYVQNNIQEFICLGKSQKDNG